MSQIRVKAAAGVAIACAALAAPAIAQTGEELEELRQRDAAAQKICRISWEATLKGENAGTAHGRAEIDRRRSDPDDSYYFGHYKGEGTAEVTYTPPAGCSVVSGSPLSVPYTVYVHSNDGLSAEVVHSGGGGTFPVVLQCGAEQSKRNMRVTTPGTAYPEIREGATVEHEMSDADGGGYTWWWRGMMTVGLCAPGERDYAAQDDAWRAEEEKKKAAATAPPVLQPMTTVAGICANLAHAIRATEASSPEQAASLRESAKEACPDL